MVPPGLAFRQQIKVLVAECFMKKLSFYNVVRDESGIGTKRTNAVVFLNYKEIRMKKINSKKNYIFFKYNAKSNCRRHRCFLNNKP